MKSQNSQTEVQAKKIPAWAVLSIIYVLVAVGIIWWLFQPRKVFRISADLLVERVTFRYIEGPVSFAQGNMESCIWQNFEAFRLEGERLLVDEELDGAYEKKLGLPSGLTLKADPDISGLAISFGKAHLERLELTSGALLTLSLPEDNGRLFRMTVNQEAALQADWAYKEGLTIQAEQVQAEGLAGYAAFLYPVQMKALPPQGLAREFTIRSFPGSTTLDFALSQQLSVESEQLFIAEPSFFKPVETVAVPTVLEGEVRIVEENRAPFQRIPLQEGDGLTIIPLDKLSLNQLKLQEGAIALNLSGQATRLETGPGYSLRNPTNLEWMWHNRRALLMALGIALVGLAVFLPEKIRERIFSVLKVVKGF